MESVLVSGPLQLQEYFDARAGLSVNWCHVIAVKSCCVCNSYKKKQKFCYGISFNTSCRKYTTEYFCCTLMGECHIDKISHLIQVCLLAWIKTHAIHQHTMFLNTSYFFNSVICPVYVRPDRYFVLFFVLYLFNIILYYFHVFMFSYMHL